jgi:CheY-like chemotaxis protein
MKGDREICLKTKMGDYISKPIAADIVRSVLSKWLVEGISVKVTY